MNILDSETPEGKNVLLRQKDEQIRTLSRQARLTDQTLESLIDAQKALTDGKTDVAAAIIMRTIAALRKET